MQLFFTLVFTYPAFPQSLSLPTGQIDLEVWKNVMITLEGNKNATFAADTYHRLVPEPAGPQVCIGQDKIPRTGLFSQDLPCNFAELPTCLHLSPTFLCVCKTHPVFRSRGV